MTLTTLAHGEPWMTPHELYLNQNLIHAIATFLDDAGVPENALVLLRVSDIAATWLLARRLESALAPADGEPAPCPTPAQANAIGKCRERLRKGVKELEEYCAKTGTPAPRGLVDQMHKAVNELKAVGFLDKNGFPINHGGGQENESQTQEPPAEAPTSPKPASNAPGDRQQTGSESNEILRARPTFQTAPGTRSANCTAIFMPPAPPGRQPPQDTG